ncbi:MAG: hypothetical protein KGI03_04150 [Patescibacteria group bacterium]|nr:hypothetical protein [Patescibacteria group bacterium]
MPKYRLFGQYKITGERIASEPIEIMSFDADTDADARAKVAEFRTDHTPIVNARLVRIGEVSIKIKDTPGYEFLPWQDCECGCQCSNVTLASRTYSVLRRGTDQFHLDYGHSAFAGKLGIFKSFADADREVRRFAKNDVEGHLAQAKKNAAQLGIPTA